MRLLVIEDERDLLRSLEMTLTDEGYAVDVAADGEEGLFKSTTWEYDAILLDLMLPRLNGIEVLQRLRREKRVPVLILTARDAVGDRVQGLDLGADDYLIKPFERAELLARLRALIRRSAGQTTACLELGDIRINTASRSVMKGGEVVELSPREYSLLEFLAMHRGQLVTRTMLYDHLFDENEDSLSNLLDVYVARLRKKLGRDMIVTKRGHGYVIDV